ncbi:MAG: acyl-CoA dehydrogenase [Alphaproteobacteria bacterium]|nr:acyl-CoA dehydrogenase [Alphaproteobacteria bacterium]PPR13224.1 MAG: Acyl-CoA dehydrogenase [Alphaproteobacteria bacterium MarineAlpha12_Bin1]
MDFKLSEEQIAIQDLAKRFAIEEILPNASLWDENSTFPIETLRKAAALGFASIYCSTDYGGSGLGRLEAALVFEELASACPSTSAYLSIHNMSSWMIDKFGNDNLKKQFLPKLFSMDFFASYCLTEPSSGSDAASLKSKAIRDGDSYVINGEKVFISGGSVSDVYVCMLRTGGDGSSGISCIVVEKDSPGLSFGKLEKKLGWNSQPTASVIFENCRVPISNLVGKEGDGFKIAMQGLDGGRINIGACSIGGARACLDLTKEYLKTRKQFGQPLADFQALQFHLADMATDLEISRVMLHKAACMFDSNSHNTTQASAMAKRVATDFGFDIVNKALQLHGGYGYLKEFPVERYLRDLRVHQILEGTNEIMRLIISRDLLRQ